MNCPSCHKPTVFASVQRIDYLKVDSIDGTEICHAPMVSFAEPASVKIVDVFCKSCYKSWSKSAFMQAVQEDKSDV